MGQFSDDSDRIYSEYVHNYSKAEIELLKSWANEQKKHWILINFKYI